METVALNAWLELSTVVFLNTQAFWNITMCRMVNTHYPSNRRYLLANRHSVTS